MLRSNLSVFRFNSKFSKSVSLIKNNNIKFSSLQFRNDWSVTQPFQYIQQRNFSTTTSESPQCLLSVDPETKIATITFNRAKQRNAFSKQFIQELNTHLDTIQHDPHARVVLFKSQDPSIFCAGADLKERAQMTQQEAGLFVSRLRYTMERIEQLPQPTIALIAGGAFGGGLELALACDMRLALKDTSMGLVETSLAIIPGAGGTQRLPRIIGMARAKELIFTARRFEGTYAEQIGLVNYALNSNEELESKAFQLASEISVNGPIAVKVAKIAIQNGVEVERQAGMVLEQQCYAQVIPTKDRIEGLTAFKEKRKPVYEGK